MKGLEWKDVKTYVSFSMQAEEKGYIVERTWVCRQTGLRPDSNFPVL
jgi:hypothetical protein